MSLVKEHEMSAALVPHGAPWHRDMLDIVEQQIQNARFPQAVLFRRRQHYFDTTLGWLIVQRLLCDVHSATDNCQHCHLMLERNHPNVFFLDVHSDNIGISDIRHLEHQMWQTAVFDKPKVAFIRGMDLLSMSAQNALLKTLEEPPQKVYFVLSVDTMSRVIPTIMSRVQRLQHTPLDDEGRHTIMHWLQHMLLAGNSAKTEAEIANVARLADFAPEHALSLLRSPEDVAALEREKTVFAQFISGKLEATKLVEVMGGNEYDQQLTRYLRYADALIFSLFKKTAQQSDKQSENSLKCITWQGSSLRSLYRLRDTLIRLRHLCDSNVNMPMQLTDYFSRWQHDRTK